MRLMLCLIPLLYGCSVPVLRCDGRLLPINPPAARTISGAAAPASPARRAP